MKWDFAREDVWSAGMEDRPGMLAGKLDALSEAGVNLEFVIARRAHDKPGTSVVFVTPIKGAKQVKAARAAGFGKTTSLHSIRIIAPDQPGLGACLTKQVAEAGINLRGFSGAAIGKQAVFHLAFESQDDAAKGLRSLKKICSRCNR